jgi:integrase
MAATDKKRTSEGIEVRHGRSCPARHGGRCRCEPSYRAEAYDRRTKRKVRKSFPTPAAAKRWRADAIGEVRRGRLRAVPSPTLRDAAAEWLEGAQAGLIRNRSGDVFKPSALRGYRDALDRRILPDLGARRLSEVTRVELQELADRLLAEGLDPSTIRNQLMPVRVIFRRAIARGEVTVNPTTGLELPAVRGRRERIAAPEECARLLEALPEDDRTLWATAMYGGLRRGELMGLRIEDVDLAGGMLRIRRSFDPRAGAAVQPKSSAGVRIVPVAAVLRDFLDEHLLRLGWDEGLVFGRTAIRPF